MTNTLSLELTALGPIVIAVGATLPAQLAFATRRIDAGRERASEERNALQCAMDESRHETHRRSGPDDGAQA